MKIYIVDDDPGSQLILSTAVSDMGHEPVIEATGESFMENFDLNQPSLVLLDWVLPGISGLDICNRLMSTDTDNYHYIILVSAKEKPEDIRQALDSGASDYITKGAAMLEMKARIGVGIRTIVLERERSELRLQLRKLARTDSFTGLLNHTVILDELTLELKRSEREGSFTGVLMIDIDNFKAVNDTYGHIIGDQVIARFAAVLRENSRPYDRIGRYGGDEFIMILPRSDSESCFSIAERMRRKTMDLEMDDLVMGLSITCSIGTCTSDHKLKFSSALVAAADNALYRAKEGGRNRTVSCRS